MKSEKLLLHVCCAPCASAVVEKLNADYQLTLLYCNPNIQPEAEYFRRRESVQKLAERYALDLLTPRYAPEPWQAAVQQYAAEPEGGRRCELCFAYRLAWTAEQARDGYAGFATTLSISPHKNLAQINRAGQSAAQKYGGKYWAFDFRSLYQRSVSLAKELGLYRQKYCGCVYGQI
ncbi:hypothetical protein NO2_0347 [Candidatus Termititenax persephonae]|uniref:Epoxyqueuosine reductase QueH n=1 Tax=Candidatus Termititenax persephonae TaxID=2218525 RepID=A0A388TFQ6_9BACT|nr:hypothetical protein NO2_0347 [Candidatus Termititenax persephonae]